MPDTDIAKILAITTGSCLLVGLIGLAVLHGLQRRSLRWTVVLTGLVPVVAVAASVLVNVHEMVLSKHDSLVILVALGWATLIAGALTVVVGRWVTRGSSALRAGLLQLDPPDGIGTGPAAVVAPAELTALVAELDTIRQRLNASRNRERALETSRRELITFMSHDLRTPLTGLRAVAEALDDGVIDDVPAAMSRIQSYVDRMTSLVEDLFELSRVTSGGARRPRRLVSLSELAMDVVAEARDHADSQGVCVLLELEVAQDRLPVLGDSDELARAMSNLVANAVRHTTSGGTVRVVGDRGEDGHVRMSVIDGCGGIPHAEIPHVFDTGWRGSGGKALDGTGAGLGLAIARGVVESHSGRIGVSNVDGGCRFELDLPTPAV
jgi:signal transduction histidine kinase